MAEKRLFSRIQFDECGATMYIDFTGNELIVDLEEESIFESKHTGMELKRIKIGLVAQTLQAHRLLLLKISRAELDGISSTDEKGNTTMSWKIVNSSFCSQGDERNPQFYHEIVIEQAEDLKLQSLCINDLILYPYFYQEEFDCDDLSIKSRVMVSPEQDARLRLLMKEDSSFQVTRRGINEGPRDMRFSNTILWSRHGNNFKYEIILVDRSYDERDRPLARLFQPQMSRMQSAVAAQAEMVDAILEALITRKYLTHGDVAEMRKKAAERIWDRRREFFEVSDIDEFLNPSPRLTWD
ncbi:MAG TPA: hypothetical protein PKL29_01815 [Methanothrix sp.]|nr:hypothetical protein [Methanothrix sp.]